MKLRREAEPELYISDEDKAAGRAKDKAAGKPKDKGEKPAGEKIGRTSTNIDEASLIVILPVVLYLWDDYQGREKAPARTKAKATGTKASAADVKVKPARTKAEVADTTGWVYRCSRGKEYKGEDQLGGHRTHYRNGRANHKNLGFGPPSKAAGGSEAARTTESADEVEPELYVSDKDKAAGKVEEVNSREGGQGYHQH